MDIYTQYYLKYQEDPAASIKQMDDVIKRLAVTETYQDPNEPYRFAAFSKEELVAALVTASKIAANVRDVDNNPYYE